MNSSFVSQIKFFRWQKLFLKNLKTIDLTLFDELIQTEIENHIVNAVINQIKKQMKEKSSFFDVCPISKIFDSSYSYHSDKTNISYQKLSRLHCINYSDMSWFLKLSIPYLIQDAYNHSKKLK